jgi:hypothetical protein
VKRFGVICAFACLVVLVGLGVARASTPGRDVRLTNDCHQSGLPCGRGYVSSYTIATGQPYSDIVLDTCTVSRGRQNEPAVGVDPRDTRVLVGSSNDYCGVNPINNPTAPIGPIWLGYYRSETSGASFVSSLVPGYPGDTSPFAALSGARTATAGDPVIAWDAEGRVFLGSESSDDPAGTAKSFGDVFVARYVNPLGPTGPTIQDGKRYAGTTIVSRGSSAPNLLGKFNDKTAINADHNTDGKCDNDVYFSYSRFTGNAPNNGIFFSRSTNHGATFTHEMKISESVHGSQFPDIAITGNSDVYVVWRQFESTSGQPNAIVYVRSTNCGQTFTKPRIVQTFIPYDAQDILSPEPIPTPVVPEDKFGEEGAEVQGNARDCGDFDSHCRSGYTFFRRDTQVRAAGDQFGGANDSTIYMVYDPTKDGTQVPTGTTYDSIEVGLGSQSAIYFLTLDGRTGQKSSPMLLSNQARGHQLFPDVSADHGILHALWWDSRNDPAYSPKRPIGNDSTGHVYRSLDVYATSSTTAQPSVWTAATRISDVTTNPNFEQFAGRTVPFAGDYLWIDSVSNFSYGVWTDWRNTVAGEDPREDPTLGGTPDEDDTAAAEFPTARDAAGLFLSSADVKQCRDIITIPATKKTPETKTFGPDTCPYAGGLDQNIYGDYTP